MLRPDHPGAAVTAETAKTARWHFRLAAEFGPRDVTDEVERLVASSGVREGMVVVSLTGSTGAVTTIEYEEGALADLRCTLDRLAPTKGEYAHNERWCDGNGFSHIRSALLKTSVAVPVVDGRPALSAWQQIVVINLDNQTRDREVVAVVVGAA